MFRLEAKILSKKGRTGPRSAAGLLAYRLGICLIDEAGQAHDYARRGQVAESGFVGADGGGWARNPQAFASAIAAKERRKDAQLLREVVLSFDRRIPASDQARLVETWAAANLPSDVGAHYAIHRPKALDDRQNDHSHIAWPDRPILADGELGNRRRQPTAAAQAELGRWRTSWAELQNAQLAELGLRPDLDPRKRERQEGEPPAEPKLGVALYAKLQPAGPWSGWAARRRQEVFGIRMARQEWLLRARRATQRASEGVQVGFDALRRSALTERLLQKLRGSSRSSVKKDNVKHETDAKRARQSRAQMER